MKKIEVEFKFEIGQVVYHKTAAHDIVSRPNAFMVVERMMIECPGGVQKSYKLSGKAEAVNEIALAAELPEFTPESEEYIRALAAEEGRRESIRLDEFGRINLAERAMRVFDGESGCREVADAAWSKFRENADHVDDHEAFVEAVQETMENLLRGASAGKKNKDGGRRGR